MTSIRVGIVGCGGRMGLLLLAALARVEGMVLAAGIDPSPAIAGRDLGTLAGGEPSGLLAEAEITSSLKHCDVLIDFTVPAATAALAPRAAEAGVALVIGTTGLDDAQRAIIARAAERVPIVMAANFSVGVNLLLGLVRQAAATLGPDYDIEILEMHHRRKIDAPSGTALALGEAAAAGRGAALETLRLPARDGLTGPRAEGPIGFAALRGGDVIGDHIVMFAGSGERIELTHKASDRGIFAAGALRAAGWVVGRAPGVYGMEDVLKPAY